MSSAAEFSGRLSFIWNSQGRHMIGFPLQQRVACISVGRPRGTHAQCKLRRLLRGEQRQMTPHGRPPSAAMSDSDSLPASGASLTMFDSPQAATAAAPYAAPSSGAVAGAVVSAGTVAGVHDQASSLLGFSSSSSLQDLDLTSSLDLDLDGSLDPAEMCELVADPSGDVQVVCESDPAHPRSLAEEAVYRPPLSPTLLQDIETKLEADLTTIAVTIIFAVGFIVLEFGINDLIDHFWGDDLLSDMVCGVVGLSLVFWVRLSKMRIMRFDMWR